MLGLKTGDAHVVRNAGGIITDDAVRSLLISHYLLGTREFMIINHTDCGMLTFQDEELRERLVKTTGAAAVAPAVFCAFRDVENNVREQILRLRSHPWMPKDVPVRGFVYDVKSGRLKEIAAGETKRATASAAVPMG
jgi:carbonic anhydrase